MSRESKSNKETLYLVVAVVIGLVVLAALAVPVLSFFVLRPARSVPPTIVATAAVAQPSSDALTIRIEEDGTVKVEGEVLASGEEEGELSVLKDRIQRYKGVADLAETESAIIIRSAAEAPEARIKDVLNVCAALEIETVSLKP